MGGKLRRMRSSSCIYVYVMSCDYCNAAAPLAVGIGTSSAPASGGRSVRAAPSFGWIGRSSATSRCDAGFCARR